MQDCRFRFMYSGVLQAAEIMSIEDYYLHRYLQYVAAVWLSANGI